MKKILKKTRLRCFVRKKNFNSTQNPWHFSSLPSLNLFYVENWKICLVNVPSAKATVILKYVYGRTTHIYFFRPDKGIYNRKFVHRHPLHLDFCRHCCHILLEIRDFLIPCFLHFLLFFFFTVLLGWMFAVEKYKLLLPRLVKIACTKHSFCDEFLWVVYFQIKRELKVRILWILKLSKDPPHPAFQFEATKWWWENFQL